MLNRTEKKEGCLTDIVLEALPFLLLGVCLAQAMIRFVWNR
jgi:hypothetical protein